VLISRITGRSSLARQPLQNANIDARSRVGHESAAAFGVLSPLTWRLADLGAKHAFLKAGLGWGHMPLHMVKADLDSGALVKIRVDGSPRDMSLPMRVVFS
jgi:DNA-binding transcriptional LysR family regulator